ncbi:hypothetical protein CBS101457_003918 [Exobasidium rhododendri]|nr:hypothetical protein CBS101457_003918 [Exobasidium rhododendri]
MPIPFPFPSSALEHERRDEEAGQGETLQLPTRTIAILAGVACNTHRLAIQGHINQHGFSVLGERLEEWSLETDQDFLVEFLRDEEKQMEWMQHLTGAPIYVMLLERIRAEQTWIELCGSDTEEDGNQMGADVLPTVESGLRASYGVRSLYASTPRSATRQIAICYPEFASLEAIGALREETVTPSTYAAVGSNGEFLLREDEDIVYNKEGKAFDAHNGQTLNLQPEEKVKVRSSASKEVSEANAFRARPLPVNKKPQIEPRLSKAAALRMGVALPEVPKRTSSTTSSSDPSIGISGLPRSGIVPPKSLQAPSIAPRLNRVAAARTNAQLQPSSGPEGVERLRKEIDYSSTPGHKRMSLSSSRPASLAAPVVAPRLNKAASARLSGVVPDKVSSNFRPSHAKETSDAATTTTATSIRTTADNSSTPGHKRMSLSTGPIKSLQAPSLVPRSNRTSQARTSMGMAPSKGIPVGAGVNSGKEESIKSCEKENLYRNTPGHKRVSTGFAIASLAQPSIVPRSNATALKRLSMSGAVNMPSQGTSTSAKDTPRPRPSSVLGTSASSKASAAQSTRPSRPMSRTSMSGSRQGDVPARTSLRTSAAPPSSFRF